MRKFRNNGFRSVCLGIMIGESETKDLPYDFSSFAQTFTCNGSD